ncbi:PREDICTED: coiled-coil domain-containing protein 114-like [Nanorana parkeri]|uniref:coiled-coil domain-containing protein 114-like n=1 Tax=Nanorana parkeri TaxID=125878 RepID=UPI0008549658|nr:PREDICTED: coiled-coil domain-containing protein 114-like [Nanorana parkeri]
MYTGMLVSNVCRVVSNGQVVLSAERGSPELSLGYFEDELKNELAWSEKKRSALHVSLRNAHHALQHQKHCLQQQENDIVNSDVTLEHLLLRQERLESRFSYLKHNNLCPGFVSRDIVQTKEHQCFDYLPAKIDSSRITDLEREINEIKMKMRRYSLLKENNFHRWNLFEERKNEEAEMQEELRQHAELMEAKCSNAERGREALDLENTSLHSGLYQAKVTSKKLEKECVKLQSQIVANRNINESLHLEVSALKKHSHTLENAVKASASENKSLHSEIENLHQENQSLCSQKELLFSIMKKRGKNKHHYEEQSKSTIKMST